MAGVGAMSMSCPIVRASGKANIFRWQRGGAAQRDHDRRLYSQDIMHEDPPLRFAVDSIL